MTNDAPDDRARYQAAKNLFFEARALPGMERRAFLDRIASTDPDLAGRVHTLLVHDAESRPEQPAAASTGGTPEMIGRYRVIEEIGRGGQGVVYLAEDGRDGARVALKVLSGSLATNTEALTRFLREAWSASSIAHPAICKIREANADGVPFIAMDWVDGETLADKIDRAKTPETAAASFSDGGGAVAHPAPARRRGQAPPRRAMGPSTRAELFAVVQLVETIARALHHAHERGLIHRDIKPSNIMVTPEGTPVLLDFGLARDEGGTAPTLTVTGDLIGTPAYMSPEQLLAKRVRIDRRTDVYSLAITLYESLTLTLPFDDPNREVLYRKILTSDPPDPRRLNPTIPAALKTVIEKATEKDSHRRYATALEFAEDLARVRAGRPILARGPRGAVRLARRLRRQPVLLAALLVAAGGLLGAAFWAVRSGLIFRPDLKILLMSPPDGSEVRRTFPLTGTATDRLASASVNGRAALCDGPTFRQAMELSPGRQDVIVRLATAEGRTLEKRVAYIVDATPPAITMLTPADGAAVGKHVHLEGVANEPLARAHVNGRPARIIDGRRFEIDLPVPREGITVAIEVEDVHENVGAQVRRTFRRDMIGPVVKLTPESGTAVDAPSVEITGTADEPLSRVTINGQTATIAETSFKLRVTLRLGDNKFVVVAADTFGNERATDLIVVQSPVTFTPPSGFATKAATVQVRCAAKVAITHVIVDDQVIPGGTREVTIPLPAKTDAKLAEGDNKFTITVVLEGGASDQSRFTVVRRSRGPDLAFSPASGTLVDDPVVVVRGTASQPLRSVTIGGRAATVTSNTFAAEITVLAEEDLEVVAVDVDGAETRTRYRVGLDGWNPGPKGDPAGAVPLELAWLPATFDVFEVASARDAPQRPTTPRPAEARRGPARRKTLSEWRMERRNTSGQETKKAVDAGLDWLMRHQAPDGLWHAAGFNTQCDASASKCMGRGHANYSVGVTGLALLAFLGAGYDTVKPGPYQETVRRGIDALIRSQDAEGCFGTQAIERFLYSHAAATMAVAEALQSTPSPQPPGLRRVTRNAVAFILACQNPYKAWRYGKQKGDNDTSATVWMLLALGAAHDAGIEIPRRAVLDGLAFLDWITDEDTGRVGYMKKGEPPVRAPGPDEVKWPKAESEALTAAATCARIVWQPEEVKPPMKAGLALVGKKLPVWDEARGSIDMYYWYYGTRAMFEFGGDDWRRWWKAMRDVPGNHCTEGCCRGSFDPKDPWGEQGGRVYSTAMMVLCLETPYRYPRRL